jgi:hypothetical protein
MASIADTVTERGLEKRLLSTISWHSTLGVMLGGKRQ